MKKSLFSKSSPGQIIEIDGGEHAFLPNPLPPSWEFPAELWPQLAEAKRQIGVLEGIGRVLPNPGILLRPLEDREAIQSSRLEGTYATPKELLLFELEPALAASESDSRNDQREVFNYRRALHFASNDHRPLSLNLLRDMHAILLEGVRGRDNNPGNFRKIQVAIGSSRRFVPPPPKDVPDCLHAMELYMHKDPLDYDPLVHCFLMHYQFETIHPFNDGNGRIGRLLLALMMQEQCKMSKPWLYLSEYFQQDKLQYVDRLFNVSTKNDWTGWVELCIEATIEQAKETISRCENLLAIKDEFASRLATCSGHVRLHQIVERTFNSPFVRVVDVANQLGVTYPTAKSDLQKLSDVGILRELPEITPKTYYAPDVFAVAYDDLD